MTENFTESLSVLFERDLKSLIKNITLYKKEENLWITRGEITNSGGNLCQHICGNLRHFIGAVIGGSDYKRQRELEFSSKNIPVEVLSGELEKTLSEVKEVLKNLTSGELQKKFPLEVMGYEMSTEYFLIHLYGHLNYHLGQVNYHRRLVESAG